MANFPPRFELSTLDGTNGFRIEGVHEGDRSGRPVSGAGDVNGDGVDDLIIGAPNATPGGQYAAGESYVVFGSKAGFAPVLELAFYDFSTRHWMSNLDGSNGFRIEGIHGASSSNPPF